MIYFDNAATTFQKPPSVMREMMRCMREYCGNPGRSGHKISMRAAEAIYDCRMNMAEFFGISKPENVIFTMNTTHAINLALGGILRRRNHVLISNLEHNSVARPVAAFAEKGIITYGIFNALCNDDEVIRNIEEKITPYTRVIVTLHASNICPHLLPISKIGALCKKHGIIYIVDAAQSAGIYDIKINNDNISVLCVPGHKGLYGPQGSGAAIFADDFDFSLLSPTVFGGNGMNSAEADMGHEAPESYEAGTPATQCIVGLGEGLKFVKAKTTAAIREHENAIYRRVRDGLLSIPDIRVFLPSAEKGNTLLFTSGRRSASAIAAELAEHGICTRSGMHCSPFAHKTLGTGGDAVRASFSVFNTPDEADRFLFAVEKANASG